MISFISAVSVLGVALGIASLIIVISVMNGFDNEVKKKIIGTYAHLMVFKDDGIETHERLVSSIESMDGVENAAAFITGQAILRKDGSVTGILLKGVDAEKETEVTDVIKYFGTGSGDLQGNSIVLGSELMKNENISEGDIVEVIIGYSKLDLEKSKLKVVGSFTSGRYDYDSNMGIVGIDTAGKIFRMKNTVSGIGIRLKDGMKAGEMKLRLRSELGYPYIVKTWMDMDKNLVSALALEKKMMFVILTLIVMVACFNISSSLIMMVMEKTEDIGILKAIGANSWGISAVFFLESVIVGLAGIITGGLSGVFIARRINDVAGLIEKLTGITVFPNDIYYFTEIPVKISSGDITTIISVAMALTLAAGIYPAWKASRLDPVDAIRYG